MKNILQIDFSLKNAKHDFVKSLSETGFAVIKNHDISKDLISKVYGDWKMFFSSKDKNKYLFDYEKQDGYFPYKSENAEGYKTKDLKEFLVSNIKTQYEQGIKQIEKKELMDLLDNSCENLLQKIRADIGE